MVKFSFLRVSLYFQPSLKLLTLIFLFIFYNNGFADLLYTGGSVFNKFSEGDRKQIQLLLKNSKVYPGKIDGEWGKSTSNGVGAAIRFIQKSNNFDDNLQMNLDSDLAFERLFELIISSRIFEPKLEDVECLAKGTSEACGIELNDTFTQQNVNSTNDEVVNASCENSQAMPVGLAGTEPMVLLESAIKAHRSLVKKGKGTIESRYKNAEIVYKKISEIVNSYGSSEVGIGLLGEACYGGVSIKSSQTNFLIAYSDYKSSGCISAPTAECLMAKALITAQNNCGNGMSGEIIDSYSAAINADLARTAIIINDTTIKDEIISNIAEKIFDGCIEVTSSSDARVNVPYLLKAYINHKMSVSKPDQAREKLKFLNGSHKLEAIYSILNKSLNDKTFNQLESFIEKDASLNSEKFKMSLVLLKMAYETNYKPPTKFLLNAANLKYDPNNEMVRGAGLTCADFLPEYEKLFIDIINSGLSSGVLNIEEDGPIFSYLAKSPVFSKCFNKMNNRPSDLSSIRLETLIALLRSQPQDIAMNFYNETKELERKIDFNEWSKPTEEYRFEIANKIFQEFNIFDDNNPAVSFSSSFDEKCNWYKKFFGSSNDCVQPNSGQSEIWNLGDRGIDLKLAYLSKKDACEGVKFMFEQSPDGEQAKYPSWYSSEEIAEANKNAFPISPRWLEIVIASIDWNIPLECGDAELELLLKE